MSKLALEVFDLSVNFHTERGESVRAVEGVTFSIEQGETFGIVGESGCGKSTLAHSILRVYPLTSGTVRILGRDWSLLKKSELRKARRCAQLIFQDPFQSLNPRMTVAKLVEEPMIIHRLCSSQERRQKVKELLSEVGLSEEYAGRRPGKLSGGERQRVAIARALALKPNLLIADEPISALDPEKKEEILRLLKSLVEKLSIAVLLISHELSAVRNICARTAVMYRGRFVEIAPTQELFSSPLHPYTRALIKAEPVLGKPVEAPLVEGFNPGLLREIHPGHWVAEYSSR